jgi:eukaryotic-like serine/threonine-protein kinase
MFEMVDKAELESNLDIAKLGFITKAEIGEEGKNSKAYIVYDPQLDADLVLKKIDKINFDDPLTYFKEARIVYSACHQNVVPVQYACQTDDHICLAMPYYKKGSLSKILDLQSLSVGEILRYSLHILSGLHYIHYKGLVHFDIKPSNILINDANEALIADFGLTEKIDQDGLATKDVLYFKHMPPERFKVDRLSKSADIYMFGLTLYRMCTDKKTFEEQFEEVKLTPHQIYQLMNEKKFPDRSAYQAHIPRKLKKIINKCLEPSPSNRYKSVLEILNELSSIEDNLWWRKVPTNTGEKWIYEHNEKILELIVEYTNQERAQVLVLKGKSKKKILNETYEKSVLLENLYKLFISANKL